MPELARAVRAPGKLVREEQLLENFPYLFNFLAYALEQDFYQQWPLILTSAFLSKPMFLPFLLVFEGISALADSLCLSDPSETVTGCLNS